MIFYFLIGLIIFSQSLKIDFPLASQPKPFSKCIDRGFQRFDLYRVILMYHPSVCLHKAYMDLELCQKNEVVRDRWMIHRVQPFRIERIPGKKFSFPICCSKEKFKINSKIKQDLFNYWRDLKETDQHVKEWMKYGTCSNLGQEFFSKFIEFSKGFNVYEILKKNGVIPSMNQTININKIHDVFLKEYQIKPTFGCFFQDGLEEPILNELSFFLTKDFKLFYDERLKSKFWSCSKDDVYYGDLPADDDSSSSSLGSLKFD